jgi:hypothetical protein
MPHIYTRTILSALLVSVLLPFSPTTARAADLDLAGTWDCLLDPQNNGESTGLHTPQSWTDKQIRTVQLPGSIQSQKFGDLPSARSPWTARLGLALLNDPKYQPYQKEGEFKSPFWLTPDRVYVGSAWFHRTLTIPASFQNQRILLTLERPHWETTVFIDGKQAAPSQNSLGTPHIYDLTDSLTPGNHTLILRVDNRIKIPVGNDASAISDQTQSNWNGIVGNLKLSTTPKLFIDDLQIFPDLPNKKIKVRVTLGNKTGQPGKGTLILTASGRGPQFREEGFPDKSFPISWDASAGHAEVECSMGENPKTWDEFNPFLYDLKATLKPDDTPPNTPYAALESRTVTFGFRQVSTSGPQLLLNGRPIQLRGSVDNAVFPLTGYPPTGPAGRAAWTKIFNQLKACGLNHLRFHSWCPPEIAFQVADEMGFYLQIEGSAWAAFGSSGLPSTEPAAPDAGGKGGAALDRWIVTETDAMLRAYGNHPSFLLMATANEPGSRTNQPNAAFLSALLTKWKAADPRHLYTAGSNWPNVPQADFQSMSRPRMAVSNELTRPPQTTSDYSALVREFPNQPVLSHETGQWTAYPNFDEIKKYTGTLHPGNLEIYQDFLNKAGMADQARDFLMASGKFQTLLYKEEVEALLRTPHLAGFQLLGINDFPGQGTAPVGLLDAFYDLKPYIFSSNFQHFTGPTVPLALLPKRIFTNNETLTAKIEISHFGAADLPAPQGDFGTRANWILETESGKTLQFDELAPQPIKTGGITPLGEISVALKEVSAPAKLKLLLNILHVSPSDLPTNESPSVFLSPLTYNDWNLWVYPEKLDTTPPQNITLSTNLTDALAALNSGKTVLLLPPIASIAGNTQGSFAPIFWNRITFPNAAVHTLSILCDPSHPAFKHFPTDSHSNWQWFDLQQRSTCKPLNLSLLPKDTAQSLKPLVQVIDDWTQARKLAFILEANVGDKGGKLLLCSIDLQTNLQSRPVARQLLYSLQQYAASDQFAPKTTLTPTQLRALFQ